jgi:hypothetical protein
MKAVLEPVDPDACEFVCCETVLPSGGRGGETWLCVITRAFAGAVDEQASVKLRLLRSERKGRMQGCGTNRYSVPADEQVVWVGYLKIVAALVPKEFTVEGGSLEDLSDQCS